MIHLSVRSDIGEMRRLLTDLERRQLPFATARALTLTARDAAGDVTREIGSAFDRPTPFTQRAVAVKAATKASQEAEVFVRPLQARYLALQERGGVRAPKKVALVNPVGVRLNQYGNIPNKALARLKARRDVYVGKIGKVAGVWQRPKKGPGKPALLMRFSGAQRVQAKPWFMPPVTRSVRASFPRFMREAMVQAMRTARR